MSRSDLKLAYDFVHRWAATQKQRRDRIGKHMPVSAVQAAALNHPDIGMRRFCLYLLDHYASDASSEVFHRALRDPVASVREAALHGLCCERCRAEELCVADVVSDLVETLKSDPSGEVRHKSVAALARFLGRDVRAGEAITRAAHDDPDAGIRLVAGEVAASGRGHVRRRKAALRNVRRHQRHPRTSEVCPPQAN